MRQIILDKIQFDRTLLLNLTQLFSYELGTCLLYSGGNYPCSKQSFLCLFPYDYIWIDADRQWRANLESNTYLDRHEANPWNALKQLITFPEQHHPFPEWVGYISYDMGAFSDKDKTIQHMPSQTPYAYLQRSAIVIAVDHTTDKGTVLMTDQAPYLLDEHQQKWVERLSNPESWVDLVNHLSNKNQTDSFYVMPSVPKPLESRDSYISKVKQAQEMIKEGEIYQVNLSQKFALGEFRDPYQLFYAMSTRNPAPYAAYLKLKDRTIVSSSPEMFLKKKGQNIETRPIKGTMPRGKTPEEDQKNKETLLHSEKEKAELLMITDLMRNDLSRICKPGSVETSEIWGCEAFENVFHLVSTIRGVLQPDLDPIDVVRTCFPGGSITGCPKLSAMEAIAALEKRSRGIYTGSIGYFAGNGDFDFNIAIRTVEVTEEGVDFQLGGAVVADSDPQKEYEETLHKGATIFNALGMKS